MSTSTIDAQMYTSGDTILVNTTRVHIVKMKLLYVVVLL